jgi:beta-lactamase class A
LTFRIDSAIAELAARANFASKLIVQASQIAPTEEHALIAIRVLCVSATLDLMAQPARTLCALVHPLALLEGNVCSQLSRMFQSASATTRFRVMIAANVHHAMLAAIANSVRKTSLDGLLVIAEWYANMVTLLVATWTSVHVTMTLRTVSGRVPAALSARRAGNSLAAPFVMKTMVLTAVACAARADKAKWLILVT